MSPLDQTDNDGNQSVWHGERVRLRAIEPSDWAVYFAWNQDDEQACGASTIPFPQSVEAVRQWAQQEATRKPEGDAFRFVIENETGRWSATSPRTIATLGLDPFPTASRSAARTGAAAMRSRPSRWSCATTFGSCVTRRRRSPSTAS